MTPDSQPYSPFDDVSYLASCAVREIAPDPNRVERMDLDAVFHEASRQMLASCCAFALESVGMCTDTFMKAKAKAVRKVVLLDHQRKEVLDRLEDAGIWYLPLKGCILKDYYPSIGMREMTDNDILYDATRTEDVRAIMLDLGFRGEGFGIGAHDNFYKEPVYNFEMHHTAFDDRFTEYLNPYYANIKERLLHDEGGEYGYHFSPEDFYLYMIAHEYKHYNFSGVGLRSCIDTYVFLSKNALDMNYVCREAAKMNIASFENDNRTLSLRLVNGEKLSDEELNVLEYMRKSGAHGSLSTRIEHQVTEGGGGMRGKIAYVLSRAFPPAKRIKESYPTLYRYRILQPLIPIVRLGKAITVSRHRVINEIRALRKGK